MQRCKQPLVDQPTANAPAIEDLIASAPWLDYNLPLRQLLGTLENCYFAHYHRCAIIFSLNIIYMNAVKFYCAP
jgi:hypothetical protein